MRIARVRNALTTALTTLGLALAASAAEAAPCVENWSEAAPVVTREKLVPIETLTRLARSELASDLVRTALCEENGRYVYKMVVRHRDGGLRNVAVDAREPMFTK
jgi:uncharacterized membrane protein YkoI